MPARTNSRCHDTLTTATPVATSLSVPSPLQASSPCKPSELKFPPNSKLPGTPDNAIDLTNDDSMEKSQLDLTPLVIKTEESTREESGKADNPISLCDATNEDTVKTKDSNKVADTAATVTSRGDGAVAAFSPCKPLQVNERVAVWRMPKKGERDSYLRLKIGVWEPGHVEKVTRIRGKSRGEKNTVKVLLESGGTCTVDWTCRTDSLVQRLLKRDDGSEYLEMKPDISRTPAPRDLKIGDAVVSWFQRGRACDDPNARFTGRVAKIEGDRCSVAYDDGDWEDNIPFRRTDPQVVLICFSRGLDEPQWLEGMCVKMPSKKHPHLRTATVDRVDPDSAVWLKYQGNDKPAKAAYHEKVAYRQVVDCVMAEAAEQVIGAEVRWPDTPPSKGSKSNLNGPDFIPKSSPTSTSSQSVDSLSDPLEQSYLSMGTGAGSNESSYRDSLDSLVSNDTVEYPPRKQPPRRTRNARAATERREMDNSGKAKKSKRTNPRATTRVTEQTLRSPVELLRAGDSAELSSPEMEKTAKRTSALSVTSMSMGDPAKTLSTRMDTHEITEKKRSSLKRARRSTMAEYDSEDEDFSLKKQRRSQKQHSPTVSRPLHDGRDDRKTSEEVRQGAPFFAAGEKMGVLKGDSEGAFKWKWPASYSESMSPPSLSVSGPKVPSRHSTFSIALCSSIQRTWKSSDTQLAADVMSQVQFHDGLKPNNKLKSDTDAMLVKGPQFGTSSRISYPDCQKMDLASEVVQDADISWNDFWEQMSSDLYTVKGDDRRMTKHAVERIAATAHAKSITAQVFLRDIQDDYPCTPLTWIREIRSNPKGPRDALQSALNTFVSLWTSYGHFYFATGWSIDGTSPDLRVFVQRNVRQLLKDLGTILSFAGQVYGMEEGQCGLAHFLSNRIETKLHDFHLCNALRGEWSVGSYTDKIKMRMVLDLDQNVLPIRNSIIIR